MDATWLDRIVNSAQASMFARLSGSLAARDRNGAFSLVGTGALRWQPAPGALINYAVNPSFEITSAWSSVSGTLEYATNWATVGTRSGKYTVTSQAANQRLFQNTYTALPPGTYTIAADIYNPQSTNLNVGALLLWGQFDKRIALSPISIPPGVSRVSWTVTTPEYIERLSISIPYSASAEWPVGTVLYADAVVLSPDGIYVDGTSGVWLDLVTGQLGTAHTNQSVMYAVAWVEEGTTTEIPDPVFGNSTIGNNWGVVGGATLTRETTSNFIYQTRYQQFSSNAVAKIVTTSGSAGQGITLLASKAPAVTAGQTRTAQVSLRRESGTGDLKLQIVGLNSSNAQTEIFETTFAPPASGEAMGENLPYVTATFANANTVKYVVRVVTATESAQTFYVGYLGCEAKPYPTSPCIGNMGTGYSWAGAAHNSASTRAATTLTFSPTGRISPVRGAVVFYARRMRDNGAYQTLLDVGNGGTGTDRLTLRFTPSGALQLLSRSDGGVTATVETGEIASVGQAVVCYAQWNESQMAVRLGASARSVSSRPAPVGSFGSGSAYLGSSVTGADAVNGAIGPIIVFDSVLFDTPQHFFVADARLASLGRRRPFVTARKTTII